MSVCQLEYLCVCIHDSNKLNKFHQQNKLNKHF
uniref:Uncharacterized protein n=1 Tax=Arundo donax TaxID=35708 RepID=A0A0A9I1V0_ARUDO